MDIIFIEQPNDKLIFERLKRSEILIIQNEGKLEIFVNIESSTQNEDERKSIESRYQTKLSEFITYAWPRLQFMDLNKEQFDNIFRQKIVIPKGWENEFKMTGIYVGWGVETFDNVIELAKENNNIILKWTCIVGDMDRYDENFKPFKARIEAKLNVIEFKNKQDFWDYEKDKMDGKK